MKSIYYALLFACCFIYYASANEDIKFAETDADLPQDLQGNVRVQYDKTNKATAKVTIDMKKPDQFVPLARLGNEAMQGVKLFLELDVKSAQEDPSCNNGIVGGYITFENAASPSDQEQQCGINYAWVLPKGKIMIGIGPVVNMTQRPDSSDLQLKDIEVVVEFRNETVKNANGQDSVKYSQLVYSVGSGGDPLEFHAKCWPFMPYKDLQPAYNPENVVPFILNIATSHTDCGQSMELRDGYVVIQNAVIMTTTTAPSTTTTTGDGSSTTSDDQQSTTSGDQTPPTGSTTAYTGPTTTGEPTTSHDGSDETTASTETTTAYTGPTTAYTGPTTTVDPSGGASTTTSNEPGPGPGTEPSGSSALPSGATESTTTDSHTTTSTTPSPTTPEEESLMILYIIVGVLGVLLLILIIVNIVICVMGRKGGKQA